MATHKTATRTISNAHALRAVGLFYSHKNQDHIAWESQLERDGFLFMECHPAVKAYQCQPETFQIWTPDGEGFRYTPDALAIFDDGQSRYVEIKPERYALEPETALRLSQVAAHFRSKRIDFVLMTDAFLRRGHRIHNLTLLYRYADWVLNPDLQEPIRQTFSPDKSIEFGFLVQQLEVWGYPIQAAYSLLLHQWLVFDMIAHRLTHRTPVWRKLL